MKLNLINMIHGKSKSSSNEREIELWRNFRKGDRKAFEILFKTYTPVLYQYGLKFYYDADIVEDCIQELFLYLWKSKENLSDVSSVKYYLVTSLRRLILKNKTIQRRQSTIDNIITSADLFTPSHELELIARQLITESDDRLTNAINQLPSRQREAIDLKYFQDKSYQEIVIIMCVNYQTARKFVYKGLQSLRKALAS
ncbi:ECF subfamily RNA polymerase sigma-24 subunit [Flammeovirgaceae bacterium 311]|nr:ECF subfamily RNA polymerase sigma-24 subunit [Flammeovirgaceae bacterium 311]